MITVQAVQATASFDSGNALEEMRPTMKFIFLFPESMKRWKRPFLADALLSLALAKFGLTA
jgi:hypothetical protein